MTREQIEQIIKSGGDRLEKLNREVAQELDNMDLSDQARDMIASTDINCIAEMFGGMDAQEIEALVEEHTYYVL